MRLKPKICECGGKHHAKGMCRKCYDQLPEVKVRRKKYLKKYRQKPEYKLYHKEHYQKNKEKYLEKAKEYNLKQSTKEKKKIYNMLPESKVKRNKRLKEYYQRPEVKCSLKKYKKEYRQKPEAKRTRNIKHNYRYKNDILYNLKCKMRNRVKQFIKSKNIYKNNTTMEIVGCTPQELRDHIEKQFIEGMSWDLVLKAEIDIDHIIPLASAKTEEEIYRLCHYKNLQPLWHPDNMAKGCSVAEV